jgi:hypothetical protein
LFRMSTRLALLYTRWFIYKKNARKNS